MPPKEVPANSNRVITKKNGDAFAAYRVSGNLTTVNVTGGAVLLTHSYAFEPNEQDFQMDRVTVYADGQVVRTHNDTTTRSKIAPTVAAKVMQAARAMHQNHVLDETEAGNAVELQRLLMRLPQGNVPKADQQGIIKEAQCNVDSNAKPKAAYKR